MSFSRSRMNQARTPPSHVSRLTMRDKIWQTLCRVESATVSQLAVSTEATTRYVRQCLGAWELEKKVERAQDGVDIGSRGRPATIWRRRQ